MNQKSTFNFSTSLRPLSCWRTCSRESFIIRIVILILVIALSSSSLVMGQEYQKPLKPEIKVLARAFSDSIVLRWAPTKPGLWNDANRLGYTVERYTLLRDGRLLEEPERVVIDTAITPAPLDQWVALFENNKYAAIAAQALYGETFTLSQDYQSDLVQVMNKVKELESRYSLALTAADFSPVVAQKSGLWFTDNSVKAGEKYLYKVYLPVEADTGYVYIGAEDYIPLPVIQKLEATFSDHTVLLRWNQEYYEPYFTAYYIERSDDGGKSFFRINEDPLTQSAIMEEGRTPHMIYIDSLEENERKYVYRVRGLTPFGEVSEPSHEVEGMGKKQVNAVPSISSFVVNSKSQVEIVWKFPEDLNAEIEGFVIERGQQAQARYELLTKNPLRPTSRTFTDRDPGISNYYRIKALGKNGEVSVSFPYLVKLQDSIPPVAPTGLVGSIDSLGIVTLTWYANEDLDLEGYRVYRANFAGDEFGQVTIHPVKDTFYLDTVNISTLTKTIYYKIGAVDHHFNPSPFSSVIELKRPDTIPPVSPVFTQISSSDEGIVLVWNNSTSSDVKHHKLFKKGMYEEVWSLLTAFSKEDLINKYVDVKVTPDQWYAYTLVAVDENGLESPPAFPAKIKRHQSSNERSIGKLRGFADRTQKHVGIIWKKQEGVENYLIYKAEVGTPLRLYKSVDGILAEFKDRNVTVNTKYLYSIKAVYHDGMQSPFTETLVVNY